jgi:uncharacterized Zn finger protein
MKNGESVAPVVIEGRTIVLTFWGKAWCTNLESYSDFENRLPRGRTYVRNGSVVDLKINKGRIKALVSGSELYSVEIDIAELPKSAWKALKEQCAGKIGTLVELLQGKLSKAVMELVTDREGGLFPKPKEIKMSCSCPDWAGMCKHVAAVMYGIGNRLDASPELLFVLRGLDHMELIEQAIPAAPTTGKTSAVTIAADDLGAIFDIEIDASPAAKPQADDPKAKSPTAAAVKKSSAPKRSAGVKRSPTSQKNAATDKTSVSKRAVATKKRAATTKAAAPTKAAIRTKTSATKKPKSKAVAAKG